MNAPIKLKNVSKRKEKINSLQAQQCLLQGNRKLCSIQQFKIITPIGLAQPKNEVDVLLIFY